MNILLLLILSVGVLRCQALSTAGVPKGLWNHVLNIEPNRHLQQLGEISETEGSLTRTYLSNAHQKAAEQVLQWMQSAGLTAHIDVIGNVHGIIEGTNPELGELLVGSHYDTVVDGGKYDGALGVLVAISAVKAVLLEALHRAGRLEALGLTTENINDAVGVDIPATAVKGLLPGSVHVVGFCDEEGIRFKSTFLGSRAVAGTLLKHNQLGVRDSDGLTLEDVLKASGVENPVEAVQALALDPARVRHYVEFHMEQGPQLEAAGLALGVVSGIAGQTWLTVSVEGVQNHGGTVPMPLRKDPMSAAAEAINAIEGTCLGKEDALGSVQIEDEALVCTVGRILVHPNQVNIIPKWVNFTVDVRCQRQEFREEVIALAEARVEAICSRRGVNCTITKTHDAKPVHSDGCLISKLRSAVFQAQAVIQQLSRHSTDDQQQAGTCSSSSSSSSRDSQPDSCSAEPLVAAQSEVPVLMSGAGHDAMAIADLTKVAMVFVRCAEGVSHNPAEFVDPADVAAATAAFATFMEMDVLDWEQHKDNNCQV